MLLSVIGLSHKTAPLEVREQVALAVPEYPSVLTRLRALPEVPESLLLSTCNRTEVYLVSPDEPPVADVTHLLGAVRDVPPAVFAPYLVVKRNVDAARHIIRVAAGLESMVVGEHQILGQVRQAFDAARVAGATGPVLNRLLQLSIAGGRRVRRETSLARRASSIPHAALAFSRKVLGSLPGRIVVIVGAGEMAGLVAKVFASAGARITAVANRTVSTAHLLASQYGAQSVGLDDVVAAAASADVLVVSVGAILPVLGRQSFTGIGPRTTPLLVIDLGVPRGVDPAVAALPGIALYDLDQLSGPQTPVLLPADDLAEAERIAEWILALFMRWLASRSAVPLIAALHARADQIIDDELARAHPRLRGLDDRQRLAVREVVEAAMRKLLHSPFVRLRASAQGEDPRVLALARELFDLGDELDGAGR
jgi:glutamyl-tRNA reductase